MTHASRQGRRFRRLPRVAATARTGARCRELGRVDAKLRDLVCKRRVAGSFDEGVETEGLAVAKLIVLERPREGRLGAWIEPRGRIATNVELRACVVKSLIGRRLEELGDPASSSLSRNGQNAKNDRVTVEIRMTP